MVINLKNISKSFEDKKILDDINFNVSAGETVAIVGFSGTGKSTILKIISGLLEPDKGEVNLSEDNVGMVFQYSALFDSLDIHENIAFALTERKEFKNKYTQDQLKKIVKEKLKMVGLSDIEHNYPSELSGGMQKGLVLPELLLLILKLYFTMSLLQVLTLFLQL